MLGKLKHLGGINPQGRRLLGLTPDTNQPVWAPSGHGSVFGANGVGKSTRVAMPAIFSFASSAKERPVLCVDVKDGEIAAQCAPMLAEMGLPVAVIDDFDTRSELAEFKVSLNPFGSIVSTYQTDPRDVIYAYETVTHALIPEPKNNPKDKYFRAWPRTLIEFAAGCLLKRNPELCTPGGVAALLADPDLLLSFAEIEAEEG
ncbi:MAG: hypothetical protein AAF636_20625 [Pseudomonadota bacterium]